MLLGRTADSVGDHPLTDRPDGDADVRVPSPHAAHPLRWPGPRCAARGPPVRSRACRGPSAGVRAGFCDRWAARNSRPPGGMSADGPARRADPRDVGDPIVRRPDGATCWIYFAAVGLVLLAEGRPGLGMLRDRRLVRLGTISYGIYLYHPFVLIFVPMIQKAIGLKVAPWMMDVAKVGACVGLAELSWRLVERPLLGFKDRFPYAAGPVPRAAHRGADGDNSRLAPSARTNPEGQGASWPGSAGARRAISAAGASPRPGRRGGAESQRSASARPDLASHGPPITRRTGRPYPGTIARPRPVAWVRPPSRRPTRCPLTIVIIGSGGISVKCHRARGRGDVTLFSAWGRRVGRGGGLGGRGLAVPGPSRAAGRGRAGRGRRASA